MAKLSEQFRLSVTQDDSDDRKTIRTQLIAYNEATLPQFFDPNADVPKLNVYLHDADGRLIGGLTGQIEWTQFHVDYLWVEEALRGRGLGSDLIRRAEAEAMARGCSCAILTTFDFQAPRLYQSLGYRVIGQIDDYPPGHIYYLMRHDFAP